MSSQKFLELASVIVHVFMAVTLVLGIIKLKVMNHDQRILFFLVVIASLTEFIGRILWQMSTNNLFLYHFYSVIEFVLLALLYQKHLEGLIKSVWIKLLMIAFIVFAIFNTLFVQKLTQFNSNATFVECVLLIILSLIYFYKLLRDIEYRSLERNPMFWINVSVLTYFSGALVLFHVANDLIPEPLKVRGVVWGVHALFNIIHYALYGIALVVRPEQKIESESRVSRIKK